MARRDLRRNTRLAVRRVIFPVESAPAADPRSTGRPLRGTSPGAADAAPGDIRLQPLPRAPGASVHGRSADDGRTVGSSLPDGLSTLGFIDIGTNSVRLMVARVGPDQAWSTITLQKEQVRLGEGEFGPDNRLQRLAMERATFVCRSFVELARAHGSEAVIAVATAATREAVNQASFLRRLREEAGLDVHVVSGKEEARLIYLGVLAKVNLEERRALVIDIGGGSTEVAVGNAGGAEILDSLKVGAIRLTSEFPEAAAGPVSPSTWRGMRRRTQVASAHLRRQLASSRFDVAYGTSGTIRNLAAVAARMNGNGSAAQDVLRRADLRKVAKHLCAADLETRRALPGLSPERADIIVAGAAILDALMDDLGVAAITSLAECGLREGLVLDHLARRSRTNGVSGQSVRERSVLRLARSVAVDEAHARHVTHLAQELFDSAAQCGLHECGQPERELLSHAGLLHDAGTVLNYSDHQAHSYYLIRNADLLGFDQREVAMIAAVALFHRKSRPGPRHVAFKTLDRRARDVVRQLSAYLRIAEYLDRGHVRAVAHATLRRERRGVLTLEVTPRGDWHLERWRLLDRHAVLEDALGCTLMVVEAGPVHRVAQRGATS